MKQDTCIRIFSEDNKIQLFVDNGTSFGVLHDFLLEIKGTVVDRMNAAQREEEEATKQVRENESKAEIVEEPKAE